MTDGERKSQHQQQWEQVYGYGFDQGYRAAVQAANEGWQRDSTWRPHVQAEQERWLHDGEWIAPMTWRERKAERLATIREAHEAGVHAPIAPAQGCPWCDYGAVAQHLANCADRNHDLSRGCDIAPLIHHNGDYGVATEPPACPYHAEAGRRTQLSCPACCTIRREFYKLLEQE